MANSAHLTPQALVEHREFVLALARSLTRDDASADDLAQDAMVAALSRPPSTVSVRGWLSTVLRTRAVDRARHERRRTTREQTAARPEATASSSTSLEQIELQHGVVSAVLALDEPYRSVVVAVYYDGLTPTQYAQRCGAPAGTVRAQLSRALAQLRTKLDAEHGDRRAWSTALLGLLDAENAGEVATGAGASASVWIAWTVSIAAAGALTFAWLATRSEPVDADSAAAPLRASQAESASLVAVTDARANADAPARVERELAQPAAKAAFALEQASLAQLLERVRQIKIVLLDRALEIDPDDARGHEELTRESRAGLVRLLERERFAELELPWMRQGGAYYSFTERVHDFNRWPQIALEGGYLSAAGEGAIVDVGAASLNQLGTVAPPSADAATAVRYDALWVEPSEGQADWSLDAAVRRVVTESLESQRFDAATEGELAHSPLIARAPARAGRSYLLRTRSAREFDLLVALHVVRVDADGCTLAWRELKRWPSDSERSTWRPSLLRDEVAPAPAELLEMSDAELRAELARTHAAANTRMFESFPADIEARFGALRGAAGSGLARLTPYLGQWTEIGRGPLQGSALSLLDGDHASAESHLGFQGEHRDSVRLHPGLDGGVRGVVLDLGAVALESVEARDLERLAGAAGRVAAEFRFPPRQGAYTSEVRDAEQASLAEFKRQLESAGALSNSAAARVGHSYAVRAVRFDGHDVLAVVQVAALDEFGAIVAWRVLEARRMSE